MFDGLQLPKILVVDDKKENLIAMEKLLKKVHADVFSASSGNEALSLMLRHKFAVVLLDVNMPTISGLETAALMKNDELTKHLPIIFVTANYLNDEIVDEAYTAGAVVDYILKPLKPEILLSKVQVFIDLFLHKQAEMKLVENNKQLKDFAHVASHDLQGPLRRIETFSEFLVQELGNDLPESANDYLDRITHSTSDMRRLIDSLLSYSRVTSRELEISNISIQDVFNEVVDDLALKIKKTNAQIELAESLPTVMADTAQMYQLLYNMVDNAIKFQAPNNQPNIKIYNQPLESTATIGNRFSQLCIEDNGIGIDEKHHNEIFGVFKRLHGKDEFEGPGIGLAICKKVVDRHGGVIRLESHQNSGAKFIVTLPTTQQT